MNLIHMIDIKELHPHPDNPRKMMGDLTELTESIRKNGIMQNITVVPGHYKGKEHVPGGYTIIIGHRRCAAAKAAGLKEVPCTIADFDLQQQLCTMMEENMQREDLTVPEQAYGFQYMLDLGVSVEEMARRTGFAESTVKHRLEIAKLNPKTLQAAMKDEAWQMTIKDFQKLEKIKDIKKREEIMKGATEGRAAFNYDVERAVKAEKAAANEKKWIALFEAMGIQSAPKGVDYWTPGWKGVRSFDLVGARVPKKLDLKTIEGYDVDRDGFYVRNYDQINLMQKENKKKGELSEREAKQKQLDKNRKEINKKAEAAVREMQHFATNAYYGAPPESSFSEAETIESLWNLFRNTGAMISMHSLTVLYPEKKSWEVSQEEKEEAIELIAQLKTSEQMLIYLSNTWESELADYFCKYRKGRGENLMLAYMELKGLYGFRFSDPEFLLLINGQHELYVKEESDGA